MFEIEFDEKTGLLRRRLSGFWTLDTVQDYITRLEAFIARIRHAYPDFRTLSDATLMPAQAAEVSIALSKAMQTLCTTNPGRVAILAGSMLSKLQMERMYPYPNVRVFLDEESARAWLFEEFPR